MKELLQQYFDGELTETAVAELRRWLTADRANVRTFLREAQLNGHLHAVYALPDERAAVGQTHVPCNGTKSREPSAPGPQGSSTLPPRRILGMTWRIAAAAMILLGFGMVLGRFGSRPTENSLGAVSGQALIVRGSEVVRSTPNMQLQPTGLSEIVVEKGGSALVQMADGSAIRLPGGTRVMLAREGESKRIYLLSGYFDADFTRQTTGSEYVLMTQNARAVVLGTTLRLSVNDDASLLSVVKGNVRLARLDGTSSVEVTSRQEAAMAWDEKKEVKVTTLHWAGRFSGGAGGCKGQALYSPSSARFKGGRETK